MKSEDSKMSAHIVENLISENARLLTINAELLEALKLARKHTTESHAPYTLRSKLDAVIAKAEDRK